ncbi:WXG100 family type VII secretion target [Leucobacter insecticola]|uniref:ESAT-6-like protein n=1 Tax=Leucobacter insecticola TaxID=2714934 RepID=A0A6G8FHS2_9MICO|nr:WXG100 family type VII secretion target [Leucobacter insecticola]QIM15915.1 WXG100 family type VII secretion target [Leucobacter insecticola]
MAGINVTYDRIETAAAKLGSGRDTITQNFRDLQTQINELVQSGFVTELASDKFNAAYNDYTASANICVDKLTEIQMFLTQTAAAMREMDSQIAAKIN